MPMQMVTPGLLSENYYRSSHRCHKRRFGTKVTFVDTPAKIDYRMESYEGFDQNQEAPPWMEMPKFMMHLRLLILRPTTDFSNK